MFAQRINAMLLVVVLAISLVILVACVKPPEQPRVEQPTKPEALLPPAPPVVPATSETSQKAQPPSEVEIHAAIQRLYKDVVTVESGRFVVGDFNGDGSQDLAVVVAPAMGMLTEINSEVANWILEDPRKIVLPNPTKAAQPLLPIPAPVKVTTADLLLAVVHGYGPSGWRNPESRQTYLLKNAVGDGIRSQQISALLKTGNASAAPPKRSGDIISETLGGEPGFLYYNGSKYVWSRKSGGL